MGFLCHNWKYHDENIMITVCKCVFVHVGLYTSTLGLLLNYCFLESVFQLMALEAY